MKNVQNFWIYKHSVEMFYPKKKKGNNFLFHWIYFVFIYFFLIDLSHPEARILLRIKQLCRWYSIFFLKIIIIFCFIL